MKKPLSAILIASLLLVPLAPQKTEAGVLEGALIGGAVGAVVGLIMYAAKPHENKMPAEEPPSSENSQNVDTVVSDSTNVIHPALAQ
ncbi:MAG: hypothetical protein A2268_14860 [Candidatus Raymondbacteria bacterium RifOxyA12_full_50_37]|uniref:Glycine zipper domain-containing protein n=1 Tax=Candidatus Raymondbacteria bacterium RIFOXYD12_FULL_49_13 TaxID=1817890 RepID=A0A1F7F2P1_UNCRA|nr:MAG: hypothetical protein A2268_14860 [Candidatus Raymondbacteria bacterium RifOxyA12_full_50_37]OGJ87842.1 MAG: hypothetical protein A2350_12805 [Candidatus Raymondbacteria bacterium RifOxyB12_full_50_8]OGJ88696.1 MAG: hypothetical protein A2248_20795 [Candidatus Raymondbacteria bacterium RIFOXYA2_FULL_49_16]OGK00868.1 MAG: hypothetical protein A2519_08050 [Candidatus Raymondbacteria bacterium RIFOXYD12_FULL_49_13]OGK07495.1 MAG: hypothetical protein A2487_19965 [Candidatus Raymondbacteria 